MARIGRGKPRQTRLGAVIRQTGAGVGVIAAGAVPALGVSSPQIILPLPTQGMQTITVKTTAAIQMRRTWNRRFPLQNAEGDIIRQTGNTTTFGVLERDLGAQPPGVILPLPTLQMQTVVVQTVARVFRVTMVRRHLPMISKVRAGIAEPSLRMPDRRLYVQVDLQAVARRIASVQRQPHSKLLTLQLLSQPPPVVTTLTVKLAGRNRIDDTRRTPRSQYIRPTYINVPFFAPTVVLATRYRKGHWDLSPPVYQSNIPIPPPPLAAPPPPVNTTVLVVNPAANQRRINYWRYQVEHALFSPAVVSPAVPTQQQQTISVTLRKVRPPARATHYVLRQGVVEPYLRANDRRLNVQVDCQAVATRAGLTRHAPHSRLSPPATLQGTPPFAPITATCAATRTRAAQIRRAPHSKLGVGIAEPSLRLPDRRLTVQVDTVAVPGARRHPAHAIRSRLAPPTVLRVFAGPAVQLATEPRIASQPRRVPHSKLRPPTVVRILAFFGPTVTLAGRNRIDRIRRGPNSTLGPFVTYPATSRITVKLAGRTRIELPRHAPHYDLQPPTVIFHVASEPPDTDYTTATTRKGNTRVTVRHHGDTSSDTTSGRTSVDT